MDGMALPLLPLVTLDPPCNARMFCIFGAFSMEMVHYKSEIIWAYGFFEVWTIACPLRTEIFLHFTWPFWDVVILYLKISRIQFHRRRNHSHQTVEPKGLGREVLLKRGPHACLWQVVLSQFTPASAHKLSDMSSSVCWEWNGNGCGCWAHCIFVFADELNLLQGIPGSRMIFQNASHNIQ